MGAFPMMTSVPDAVKDDSINVSVVTSIRHCALACTVNACRGADDAAPFAAAPVLAATTVHIPAADGKLQACQGVRIIDSHGDTFRADNARREALALAMAVSRVE
ncbi:MAG: hypothetical protein M3Y65_09470 [Pseudomonadota bacterium]|nr:hypothetical protein [Pseudomonadota bacterium]